MSYVFMLVEEDAFPRVLTRRVLVGGPGTDKLELMLDIRAQNVRARSLRRSNLLSESQDVHDDMIPIGHLVFTETSGGLEVSLRLAASVYDPSGRTPRGETAMSSASLQEYANPIAGATQREIGHEPLSLQASEPSIEPLDKGAQEKAASVAQIVEKSTSLQSVEPRSGMAVNASLPLRTLLPNSGFRSTPFHPSLAYSEMPTRLDAEEDLDDQLEFTYEEVLSAPDTEYPPEPLSAPASEDSRASSTPKAAENEPPAQPPSTTSEAAIPSIEPISEGLEAAPISASPLSAPAEPVLGGSRIVRLEGRRKLAVAQVQRLTPGDRLYLRKIRRPDGIIEDLRRDLILEVRWADHQELSLGHAASEQRFRRAMTQGQQVDAWLLPKAQSIIAAPLARPIKFLQDKLKARNIPPMFLMALLGLGGTSVAAALTAFRQHEAATAAEERAAKVEGTLARRDDALTEAQQREASLRNDFGQALVNAGAVQQASLQAVAVHLADGMASIELRKVRGEPFAGDASAEKEEHRRRDRVLGLLRDLKATRQQEGIPRNTHKLRLTFVSRLESDLPPHVLLWHALPTKAAQMPLSERGPGLNWRGLWGISSRIAKEQALVETDSEETDTDENSAAIDTSLGADDLRARDDTSAQVLIDGLRETRAAILNVQSEGRLPVWPHQLHLWTVALWHAYNHQPEQAIEESSGLTACVDTLMQELMSVDDSKGVGVSGPVLPDIYESWNNDVWSTHRLIGTTTCPWRSARIREGLEVALKTVVDDWLMEEAGR